MKSPILFAFTLDGPDRGKQLQGQEITETLRADTLAWAHLDATHPEAQAWISDHLEYLSGTVTEALTQPETRPRALPVGDGLLVNLRGVNLNDGKDQEDMVAVRAWVDSHRIVTLSRQRVRTLEDIAERLEAGTGPATAGEFLALLANRMTQRIEPFIADLDHEVDALEPEVIRAPRSDHRRRIVELRLALVELRRHMAPQRDALKVMVGAGTSLLSEADHDGLLESHDRMTRLCENADELRDNLQVMRDELSGALSERLNGHMYTLSVISGVFLPLGFLTGLFGINLAGMPGSDWPYAFWAFSGALVLLVGLVSAWLIRLRWM